LILVVSFLRFKSLESRT